MGKIYFAVNSIHREMIKRGNACSFTGIEPKTKQVACLV